MTRRVRRDVYGWTKARDMPGKAEREKSLWTVVSDSSDCRAGVSDNLQVLGDEPDYPWRKKEVLMVSLTRSG
jgi:hypothetical protein